MESKRTSTSLGDRIQLVKEENTGRSRTSLIEHVADIRFALTKPHREKLRTLDRDEVRLAFASNRLRQQRLSAARRTVEEHSARWLHAELEVLLRVLHRVLHQLLQLALHVLQT